MENLTIQQVSDNTRTEKFHKAGISFVYSHIFEIDGTTYEKTTDGMILFHSNETHQAIILNSNYADKKTFARVVVEHYNERITSS